MNEKSIIFDFHPHDFYLFPHKVCLDDTGSGISGVTWLCFTIAIIHDGLEEWQTDVLNEYFDNEQEVQILESENEDLQFYHDAFIELVDEVKSWSVRYEDLDLEVQDWLDEKEITILDLDHQRFEKLCEKEDKNEHKDAS